VEHDRLISESRLQRLCAEVLTGRAMASRTRSAELREEARAVAASIAQRRRQDDRRERLGARLVASADHVVPTPVSDRPTLPDGLR
jgi:hypothetical protein